LASEAVPPAGDGVGVTGEFFGDLEVGGLIGLGTAKDEARPEGESLRSAASVGEFAEAVAFVRGEGDASRFTGHGGDSLLLGKPDRDDFLVA
jgi:hypothetical protein